MKYSVNVYTVDCKDNEDIYENIIERVNEEKAKKEYKKTKDFYESCGNYSVIDEGIDYIVLEDFDRTMNNKIIKMEKS